MDQKVLTPFRASSVTGTRHSPIMSCYSTNNNASLATVILSKPAWCLQLLCLNLQRTRQFAFQRAGHLSCCILRRGVGPSVSDTRGRVSSSFRFCWIRYWHMIPTLDLHAFPKDMTCRRKGLKSQHIKCLHQLEHRRAHFLMYCKTGV